MVTNEYCLSRRTFLLNTGTAAATLGLGSLVVSRTQFGVLPGKWHDEHRFKNPFARSRLFQSLISQPLFGYFFNSIGQKRTNGSWPKIDHESDPGKVRYHAEIADALREEKFKPSMQSASLRARRASSAAARLAKRERVLLRAAIPPKWSICNAVAARRGSGLRLQSVGR
jgi:hypothetical protein